MRYIRLIAMLGLVVLLGLAAGCSPAVIDSSSAGAVVPGTPGTPATVQVTLLPPAILNGLSATVRATVEDSTGAALPGVTVSFTVISAVAGSFSPASATTNASGVATTTFTAASPAGDDQSATIMAAVIVGTGTINGSAQIVIGTPLRVPSSVLVSLGTPTIANGGSATVTATVSDALGLISGATVTFSVSVVGAGSFSPASATTNASGVATTTFTAASPAGDNLNVNITATAGAVSNSAQLTIGTPSPPTPTSVSVTISPLSVNIQSQAIVSVTVLGATGPAFSTAVTLDIIIGQTLASFSTGTTQSSIIVTTNASGIATAPIYTGTSSGSVTVRATVNPLTPASASFLITSPPASISLNVVNSNLTNGQTTNISATVLNAVANPVTDGTVVNFAITSICPCAGNLSAAAASTVNGIASVTFTADPVVTGGVIIQATVSPLSPVQTIIIVNPTQAGSLQFVSVSPTSGVIATGGATATLTFRVLNSQGTALGGQSVTFSLPVAPADATLSPLTGNTASDGTVITTILSGLLAGPVRVDASTTVTGPPAATLTASSGALSIGGGVPSASHFDMATRPLNVAAYLDDANSTRCLGATDIVSVFIADRFGNYNIVQGTSVSFFSSAGAIDTSNITDATGQTNVSLRTQSPWPTDVTPLSGEPSWTDAFSKVHNPRDGWVEITAVTTGEESFFDANADGIFSSGTETFDDLGEPFVDKDRDFVYSSGDLFFDWPASVPPHSGNAAEPNGVYDIDNGQWDASIPIFQQGYIVFTGAPHAGVSTSRIRDSVNGASGVTIAVGATETFNVYVSDINMNPPVTGTSITATATNSNAQVLVTSSALTDIISMAGPAVLQVQVTNGNTTGVPITGVNLNVRINWPGSQGCSGSALTVPISYTGITLN